MGDLHLYRKPRIHPAKHSLEDLMSKNVMAGIKRDPPPRAPDGKGKGSRGGDDGGDLVASMAKRLSMLERDNKEKTMTLHKMKSENDSLKKQVTDMKAYLSSHDLSWPPGHGTSDVPKPPGAASSPRGASSPRTSSETVSEGPSVSGTALPQANAGHMPRPPTPSKGAPEAPQNNLRRRSHNGGKAPHIQGGPEPAPQAPPPAMPGGQQWRRASCSGEDRGPSPPKLRPVKDPLRGSSDKVLVKGSVSKGSSVNEGNLEALGVAAKRAPAPLSLWQEKGHDKGNSPMGGSSLNGSPTSSQQGQAKLQRVPSGRAPSLQPLPGRRSISSFTDLEALPLTSPDAPHPLNNKQPLPSKPSAPLPSKGGPASNWGASGGGLPFSLSKFMSCVDELNQLAGDGCGKIMAGTKGGHVLKTQEAVRVVLYKDGMQLHRSPPRPWADPAVAGTLRDIFDVYFPSSLKADFPDGVPLKVVDRTSEEMPDPSAPAPSGKGGNVHSFQDLEERGADPVSKKDFLSKLPQSVIRNGKVIDIRGGVASAMGVPAQCDSSTAAPTKPNVVSTHMDNLLDTCQRNHVGPVLPASKSGEDTAVHEITTLQVKSEDGSQMYILKLKYDDSVATLRADLDTHRQKLHAEDGKFRSKAYEIRSAFPARNYEDKKETLRIAGLIPNATLFLRILS